MKKNHIFISYSTKDRDIAFDIVSFLEQQDLPCWIAPRDISKGHDYTDLISDAIENCSAVVLVCSTRSLESQYVKKEIDMAISCNKMVVPFKIDHVTPSKGFLFLIGNIQWIEAASQTHSHFPEIIHALGRSTDNVIGTIQPTLWERIKDSKTVIITSLCTLLLVAAILVIANRCNGDKPVAEPVPLTEETQPAVDTATLVANADTAQVIVTDQQSEKVKKTDPKVKETKRTEKKTLATPAAPASTSESSAKSDSGTSKSDQTTAKDVPAAKESSTVSSDYSQQLREANRLINSGRYPGALRILMKLKEEHPGDVRVERSIELCRKRMEQEE